MTIIVTVGDGPERPFDEQRAWAVLLRGGHLEVVVDDEAPEDELLGRFVHFTNWLFRATAHPDVSRVRLNAAPVEPRTAVKVGPVVHLDLQPVPAPATGQLVPLPAPPSPPQAKGEWQTIGRMGGGADIEIDDPTLRRVHAAVRPAGGQEWLVVARQGTVAVNGRSRSSGPVGLGDALIIGQTVLRTADLADAYRAARPAVPVSSAGRGLSVRGVGLSINNGRRQALVDLDFQIQPGSLVAVVGPSGAGKSTLMGAMLGGRRIVGGELRIGDVLLRPGGRRDVLRRLVHFVPQQDNLFPDLTVRETLDGAARLRLARDTTAGDRAARVEHVLDDLGLTERQHAKVGDLSGGERRRVSIGVELVGQPALLLLDEPTSGLDLGKDRALLRSLRRISDGGCTVIVISHSVAHLDEVDQVLVLATGGRLARNGRPAEVVELGRHSGWADLLDSVSASKPVRTRRPVVRLPQTLLGRQLTVLLRRGPWYAAGMALLPLGGAWIAAVAGPEGLRPAAGLTQVLAILVAVAALSGSALSYLDLVVAEGIYKRDWRVGVPPRRIVLTPFAAYAAVAMLLAGVMVAAFGFRRSGFPPAFGVPPALALYLVVAGVLVASAAFGMLISAAVSTTPHAVTANTTLALAQVLLNGSLFTLPSWLAPVTLVLPARLGFAAAANYGSLDASRRQAGLSTDALWTHDGGRFWLLLGGLVVVTVLSLAAAVSLVRLRWRTRVE